MADKNSLQFRSKFVFALRNFFHNNNFTEVETPIRLKAPANEDYIDAIASTSHWLRTSPELQMKRLLCDGFEKIFQIGACFRQGEFGQLHREEFSMLEWYEVNKDYLDTFRLMQYLCRYLGEKTDRRQEYFAKKWQVLSLENAFKKFADTSLSECVKKGAFEEVLSEQVEKYLGIEQPTIIIDYPASMAAMSKVKQNDVNLAERWELYIDGIEIANAYTELNDAVEQRRRFDKTIALRQGDNRVAYPIDEAFLEDLSVKGLAPCSGIAVGVDRLCLAFLGAENIAEVLAFSE